MANEPRFSRRFLTILIIVTAFAIAILSRLGPQETDAPESQPEAMPKVEQTS